MSLHWHPGRASEARNGPPAAAGTRAGPEFAPPQGQTPPELPTIKTPPKGVEGVAPEKMACLVLSPVRLWVLAGKNPGQSFLKMTIFGKLSPGGGGYRH